MQYGRFADLSNVEFHLIYFIIGNFKPASLYFNNQNLIRLHYFTSGKINSICAYGFIARKQKKRGSNHVGRLSDGSDIHARNR